MIRPSKRFLDRAKTNLRRYQKVLESAKARDIGESDTVLIVTDFLADVLGYDKYSEITAEFVIRSTFCDLAIKTSGQLRFLIEVKRSARSCGRTISGRPLITALIKVPSGFC